MCSNVLWTICFLLTTSQRHKSVQHISFSPPCSCSSPAPPGHSNVGHRVLTCDSEFSYVMRKVVTCEAPSPPMWCAASSHVRRRVVTWHVRRRVLTCDAENLYMWGAESSHVMRSIFKCEAQSRHMWCSEPSQVRCSIFTCDTQRTHMWNAESSHVACRELTCDMPNPHMCHAENSASQCPPKWASQCPPKWVSQCPPKWDSKCPPKWEQWALGKESSHVSHGDWFRKIIVQSPGKYSLLYC